MGARETEHRECIEKKIQIVKKQSERRLRDTDIKPDSKAEKELDIDR